MKTNFLTDLLRRRLENRRASSAVAAESKAIKSTSTSILDTITQLANQTGKDANDIVAEYVGGNAHPEIDAAIAKSKNGMRCFVEGKPASPEELASHVGKKMVAQGKVDTAELDRMERDSKAAKAQREKQLQDTKKAFEEQSQKRKSIEKQAVKAPTPAPSRFADASESFLHQAATHRSSPPADRAEALNELNRRGVIISKEGIMSVSKRGGRDAKKSKN